MITDHELNLFTEWNDTNTETTNVKSVIELFNEQVASGTEKPALSFQKEKNNLRGIKPAGKRRGKLSPQIKYGQTSADRVIS